MTENLSEDITKITDEEVNEIEKAEANGEPILTDEILKNLITEQLIEDDAELEQLAELAYNEALAMSGAESKANQ